MYTSRRVRFSGLKAQKTITHVLEELFKRVSPTCRVYLNLQGDDDKTLVCTIWDYDYGYSDVMFLDLHTWVDVMAPEAIFYRDELHRLFQEARVVGLYMSRLMDHVAHLGTTDDFFELFRLFGIPEFAAHLIQTTKRGLRVTEESWSVAYDGDLGNHALVLKNFSLGDTSNAN